MSQLNRVLVELEAQLDFSDEEDVVDTRSDAIQGSLNKVLKELAELLKNYGPYEKNSLKKNKEDEKANNNELSLIKEFLEYKRFKIMFRKAISDEID